MHRSPAAAYLAGLLLVLTVLVTAWLAFWALLLAVAHYPFLVAAAFAAFGLIRYTYTAQEAHA